MDINETAQREQDKNRARADRLFEQIAQRVAALPGVTAAEAFAIGALVREHGNVVAGIAATQVLVPFMERALDPTGPRRAAN